MADHALGLQPPGFVLGGERRAEDDGMNLRLEGRTGIAFRKKRFERTRKLVAYPCRSPFNAVGKFGERHEAPEAELAERRLRSLSREGEDNARRTRCRFLRRHGAVRSQVGSGRDDGRRTERHRIAAVQFARGLST